MPEIDDDWQRDPHSNIPGAAERLGVRIVDQSQQTYKERHEANRLATGKYVKRKRGRKNIAHSEKKRRRWETKRDLESQKTNLRHLTAPTRTNDAGNRREEISSGYATPEEDMEPAPRPAPPSPPTDFAITRLARDISPSRIQIRVRNEEEEERQEERQEEKPEGRPEEWILSHQHGDRWPYRVLPEREDPQPSDGVKRQREKIQHLMTPAEQLRIAEGRYQHFWKDQKGIDYVVPIDPVDLIDFLHRYFGIGYPDEDRAMAISGFLKKYGSDPDAIMEKRKWARLAGNVNKILGKQDEWNQISDKEREKEIRRQREQATEKKKKLEAMMASKDAATQQQQQQQQEQQPGPSRERLSSVISRGSSKASKKDSTETVSSEWSGPEYERASKKGKKLQKRKEKREEKKESSSEEEEEEEEEEGTGGRGQLTDPV